MLHAPAVRKMIEATTKAGIFFPKLSLSPLQDVSSYQKSSPVNHPSAALLALLHTGTAALHLLPLKNFHLRTRHTFKQGTNTTYKILLANSMESCLSPARPMSQVGRSSVSEQARALGKVGTFPSAGPLDKISLPEVHHGRSPARPGSLHTAAGDTKSNQSPSRAKSK